MLGHELEIRLRAIAAQYEFGDGDREGPTDDFGGPWPDGSVTHTYETTDLARAYVTVTYTADYRLDGGPWTPVPYEFPKMSAPGEITPVEYLTRNVAE